MSSWNPSNESFLCTNAPLSNDLCHAVSTPKQSHHHQKAETPSEIDTSGLPDKREVLLGAHREASSGLHESRSVKDSLRDRNQEENDSPPPEPSSPTTGTATTPSSGASSPTSHHASSDRSRGAPEFPGESLGHSTPHSHAHRMGDSLPSGDPEWDHELMKGYAQPPSLHQAPSDPTGSPHVTFSPLTPSRYSPVATLAAIKFLVSNNVAGSIIGRSGQTISDLQKESSTRIKLSQSGDYYPGTQERVCLVQGQPENVKKASSLLLTRLYTLQQQQHHTQQHAWQRSQQQTAQAEMVPPENADPVGSMLEASSAGGKPSAGSFLFVVRILIPTPCCGMIIGKSGSNIKQLVDATGVTSIRLASKEGADPSGAPGAAALVLATSERAVTITGHSLQSCIKCLLTILDSMEAHPDICRYVNMTTSYLRLHSTGPEVTGVPPAAGRSMTMESAGTPPSCRVLEQPLPAAWDPVYGQAPVGPPGSFDLQSGGGSFDTQPMSPYPVDQRIGSPPGLQAGGGFVPHPASPLGLPRESIQYSPVFGGPPPVPFVPSSPSYPQSPQTAPGMYVPYEQQQANLDSSAHSGMHVHTSMSAPDLLSMQFQESVRLSPDAHHGGPFRPMPIQYSPSPSPATAAGPQNAFMAQVSIPDSLIGSILGRAGRTLTEIQQQSNTRIRISQKGEYIPGTRNRIVTIRGPTAQSVAVAQFLMSQRMVLPPTAVAPEAAMQPVPMPAAAHQHAYRRSMSDSHAPRERAPASTQQARDARGGPPPSTSTT
jgi:predicted RNA-binding protein YlqC (UPF0109 family)